MIKSLLTFIFFSFSALALQGIVEIDSNQESVLEGTPLSAKIYLGPASELEGVNAHSIELMRGISVAEVLKAEVSKNNADLIEMDLKAVALGQVSPGEIVRAKIGSKVIGVEWRGPRVEQNKNVLNQIVTIPKEWNEAKSRMWPWILLTVLVLIALIVFIVLRKRKEAKMARLAHEEILRRWDRIFCSAKSRKDFEEIYKARDEWNAFGKVDEHMATQFLEMVDSIQYAREWSEIDFMKVENSFEIIRESFK